MNTMLEEMRNFHNTHSQDEILAIWKSLDKYSDVGILASEYIEYIKNSNKPIVINDVSLIDKPEEIEIKNLKNIKNPKFTSDSFFYICKVINNN
jgi:hypothetical protein